jgi:hypothetical protein
MGSSHDHQKYAEGFLAEADETADIRPNAFPSIFEKARRRSKMKRCLPAAVLLLAPVAHSQQKVHLKFSGTAINNTDPSSPVAAPIEISLNTAECKMTVSPPLIGSGLCHIEAFDKKTGQIQIVSYGHPIISWSGTIKGNLASGTYRIDAGHQTGSFYFAVLRESETETRFTPPAQTHEPTVPRTSCSPAIESSITGDSEGWDGETIFKLDNGEIWQQAVYDYTYFYEYHPDVTIYQTSEGCRMKVEDEDETVIVKRIK